MKLLIDFGAIKTGGGVQLATNFLNQLAESSQHIEEVYLLVPDTGPLSKIDLKGMCKSHLYYPNNYLKRKIFEWSELKGFVERNNIDTVYTFFGAGLPRYKGVKAVVSVAYPIICYPDSPYWGYIAPAAGAKKRVVNVFRRMRIRAADLIVVETQVMAQRMEQYAGVKSSLLRVIPPSPSLFIADMPFTLASGSPYRILILSGVDPHKNLWRLPEIAMRLLDLGCNNFKFVISVDKQSFFNAMPVKELFDEARLEKYFDFVGGIPADQIEQVYQESDFLINISDLESFSNNYMEAWKSGLPLICSDTDFSRNICGESAIYVNPHDAASAATAIQAFLTDSTKQQLLANIGKERLKALPDAQQKFDSIMAVLKEVSG